MKAQNAHDDAEMHPQEEHARGAACVHHTDRRRIITSMDGTKFAYPLKMLPLLFFELVGKSMWVLMWGLPLWSTGQLTPDRRETLIACLVGIVLVPLVMPSGDVLNRYVKAPGDPWRKRMISSAPEQSSSRSPPTASARL